MSPNVKFLLQVALMFVLVVVDAAMFWFLIDGLVIKDSSDLDPAVSAIVGGLAGAVTTSIGMGARDIFNPRD